MSEKKYRVLYTTGSNGEPTKEWSRPLSLTQAKGCLALKGAIEIVEIVAVKK